ncbi:hypothetical protein BO86DRAFT_382710 [Aspergillus japonicus CBS 114.51]|uniref:Uncharacterized protein n=1 Tax=Aspergillus japonicus CBS 114.51 TaxID=1448312 RepID=A0A8T8WQB6_ASPJA|nr:hypothetical protein BO86DRAFT_382710 [Aspergillus japonicus CBS 114.51]RAH77772.1 hypothetical protein BO86DRAFT_382710 [Aspergillus japonicus CBS 114.51]
MTLSVQLSWLHLCDAAQGRTISAKLRLLLKGSLNLAISEPDISRALLVHLSQFAVHAANPVVGMPFRREIMAVYITGSSYLRNPDRGPFIDLGQWAAMTMIVISRRSLLFLHHKKADCPMAHRDQGLQQRKVRYFHCQTPGHIKIDYLRYHRYLFAMAEGRAPAEENRSRSCATQQQQQQQQQQRGASRSAEAEAFGPNLPKNVRGCTHNQPDSGKPDSNSVLEKESHSIKAQSYYYGYNKRQKVVIGC